MTSHMSFWNDLPKPIMALAPMADVTDAPFREIIAKYSRHKRKDGTKGAPDVFWTEFVAADGLAKATQEGRKKLMADLKYTEEERPIVAQIFSGVPEHMEQAAALCRELRFDGIDINMGCPHKVIEKQGCGAAMIKNHDAAIEIIRATKRGARDVPVSVKTRLGYNTDILEEWLPKILAEDVAALTIHARTRKDMSKVPARWERIKRAVEIRDKMGSNTIIIGNGDANSIEDAENKIKETGADGVMFGRAIFGNPWFFHPDKDAQTVSIEEKLKVLCEHSKLFEKLLPFKNFAIMKKHYKAYVTGFDGARELRNELMAQNAGDEVTEVVNRFLASHK